MVTLKEVYLLQEREDLLFVASELIKNYRLKSKVKFGTYGKDKGGYNWDTDTINLSVTEENHPPVACLVTESDSYLTNEILLINALTTPFASTPGWEKKFLSSADKNALITFFVIELKGTNTLFSLEKSATSSPFPEYTLLDTGGL